MADIGGGVYLPGEGLGRAGIERGVVDWTLYLVLSEDAEKPDVYQSTTGHWVVALEE